MATRKPKPTGWTGSGETPGYVGPLTGHLGLSPDQSTSEFRDDIAARANERIYDLSGDEPF